MPVENEAPIQEEPAQPEEPVEPKAPAQGTMQVAIEFINSSDTKFDRGGDMVIRNTMTIDRFMPGARQTTQEQPPQGRGQTPPPQLDEPERGNVSPSRPLQVRAML